MSTTNFHTTEKKIINRNMYLSMRETDRWTKKGREREKYDMIRCLAHFQNLGSLN